MFKTRAEAEHRTFLLASFLWLLCYLAICLIVVDPLQLNELPTLNGFLIWLMLGLAAFAMGVALLWGVKELQRRDSGVGKRRQTYPSTLQSDSAS